MKSFTSPHSRLVFTPRTLDRRLRWLYRMATMLVGASVIWFSYATAQQVPPDGSIFDPTAGTTSVDPSTLPPISTSPTGMAIAPLGTSGPQGAALVLAAQPVTSPGRTAGQFSVTASGAATYNIPVWTPPGAREIEPRLALHYASGGPDGPMGPGWTLTGTSAIARCGKTWASNAGVPTGVTLSTSDDLCLDGNRLRLTSGTQGVAGSTYQTEIADFSNVTAYSATGNGPAYFIVQGKDGRYYEYGNTTDSQIFASGTTTPYVWGLNKVRDRQGNNMAFTYNAGTVLSLQKIQYTATPGTGFAAPYEVDFNYVTRTGGTTISKNVAGGTVSQTNQLDNINVLASGTTVRRYGLTYAASPTTTRPMLQSVQECGGSAGADCLRPTTITYQSGGAGWSGTSVATGLTGQYGFLPLDLNGDGILDALYAKLAGSTLHWYARIATTTGYGAEIDTGAIAQNASLIIPGSFSGHGKTEFLAAATATTGTPWYLYSYNGSGFTVSNTGMTYNGEQQTIDWDGDGLPDLMAVSGNSILIRKNTTPAGGAVSFASTTTTVYTGTHILSGHFGYQPVSAADFNGDGRSDLYVLDGPCSQKGGCNPHPVLLMSNGFGALATAYPIPNGPQDWFSIGDFNGDGCTDLITRGGVYISNCAGGFTFVANATPTHPDGSPVAVMTVDWDGDGQTDRMYADPTTNTWYVQRSTGTGFAAAVSTGISVPVTSGFFVADRDSDGQPDLMYVDAANSYNVGYYRHNAINTPPDLAMSIADGFGITFSPSYIPISQSNYAEGTTAVFPDQDFQGPMYVVSQFTGSDGTGGTYTDNFYYWGARLNLQGRGFEGFAMARQNDSRNGTYQVTTYQQQFPYIGAISEVDTYQPNLSTFMSKVANTYAYTNLAGTNCSLRCFPYISSATTSHYEVGGTKNGQLMSTDVANYTYDTYGNLTTTAITQTDNDFYSTQQWTTTIVSTITNDSSAANWCLGRPSRSTTAKVAPGQTAQTRTVDHTIDYVACRATAEIAEPLDPKLKMTTNFLFDPTGCGNTTSVSVVGLDQNGAAMPARTTLASYGTRCQFPEFATNPLNQTATAAYRYDLGVKSSATDPNGIAVSWLYDNFGRKTKETRPDSTYTTWSYADCVSSNCWGLADLRFLATETLFSSSGTQLRANQKYYDGLDRLRFDEFNRVLGMWTTAQTNYDALGRKTSVALPASSSSNGYHYYSYDLANRVTADALYAPGGVLYRTIAMGYVGDTVTVTDPRGNIITRVSDLTGKIRQVTDPAPGGTTKYTFDPFGNLVTIVDATNNTSSFQYNIRGFKFKSIDADAGTWNVTPDSLNELVSQTDAKAQVTSFGYDLLGRMTSRLETTESQTPTTWTYGTSAAAHNIGRLQSVSKPDGYAESYAYDSIGRPQTTTYTEDAVNYRFDYAYNTNGTLDAMTYPTSTSGVRWVAKYVYDAYGYANKTQDAGSGAAFWVLNSANDSSLPTNELLGNGIQVVSAYTPQTNEIITRTQGPGGNLTSLQNLGYSWDLAGNLQQRHDIRQGLTEAFVNDPMNRLTSSTLNGITNLTVGYDAAGNIANKSDVSASNYVYGDSAHKHAVTTAGSWNMTYDANGNMITRAGGAISWYSYNLPNQINYNGSSAQFNYNGNHQRWKQTANYAGTTETVHYIGGALEVMTRGSVTEYRHQIPAGSSTAIYTRRTDGTSSTYYATSDHLGSADLVLDSSGGVLARESFTAFGARRGSNWAGIPTTGDYTAFTNTTRKGFTGHEMLDAVSLIHMNGRVYDPYLGRFLSTDSAIQSLGSSQSINPYAYAWNDPLRYIDPSGHNLLGDLVGWIVTIVVAIVLVYTGQFVELGWFLQASAIAAVAGFVGGFVGAYISTGSLSAALTAGLIMGLVAGLTTYTALSVPGSNWGAIGERVLARAAIGCAAAAASNGNCGKGAVAAGVEELANSKIVNGTEVGSWGPNGQAAVAGVVGGVAARIAGGNFVEGFSFSAASYLLRSTASGSGSSSTPATTTSGNSLTEVTVTAPRYGFNDTTWAWTYANGFQLDHVNNGETVLDYGGRFALRLQQQWVAGSALFGGGAAVSGVLVAGAPYAVGAWETAVATAGSTGKAVYVGLQLTGVVQDLTGASALARVPLIVAQAEASAAALDTAFGATLEASGQQALEVALAGLP